MKQIFKVMLSMGCFLPLHSVAGEPIVNPPTASKIVSQITACSKGDGKIVAGKKIEIKGKDIPTDGKWFWRYSGNAQCQRLPNDLTKISYTHYETTGRKSGDKIMVSYGTANRPLLFQYTFTIPEGTCAEGECYFECSNLLGTWPPNAIGCELMNDEKRK